MNTPKTLAARLREIAERVGNLTGDRDALLAIANHLSAPDVGAGLTRFGFVRDDWADGGSRLTMKEDGEFIRYEDVAPLIAAARAVPADVELETTAQERDQWRYSVNPFSVECKERLLRDFNRIVLSLLKADLDRQDAAAALAASTAREKAKDAEIARLDALVWHGIDATDLSTEHVTTFQRAAARFEAKTFGPPAAALSGRKPDTKER